jgi:Spy/CpxP family protein refolding chaperone
MKHSITMLALALLFIVAGVAITQPPDKKDGPPKEKKGPPPPKGGFDFLARVVSDLELTEAQKAKADPVLKAHEEKLRDLFKKLHDAHKKIDEDAIKELQAVLKDEQFQRLEDTLKKGPPGKDFEKNGPPKDKKDPPKDKQAAKNGVRRDADRLARQVTAEALATVRQILGKLDDCKCED